MEPVIVQAYRTPQDKEDGVFANVRGADLSIPLINEMVDSTGLTDKHVDDLFWGCVKQEDEQGNNLARVIALLSELGESVPATTIDRQCASSAQAITSAADAISFQAGSVPAGTFAGTEPTRKLLASAQRRSSQPAVSDARRRQRIPLDSSASTQLAANL